MGSRQQFHGNEDLFSAAAPTAHIYYNGERITMTGLPNHPHLHSPPPYPHPFSSWDILDSNDGANVALSSWLLRRPLIKSPCSRQFGGAAHECNRPTTSKEEEPRKPNDRPMNHSLKEETTLGRRFNGPTKCFRNEDMFSALLCGSLPGEPFPHEAFSPSGRLPFQELRGVKD